MEKYLFIFANKCATICNSNVFVFWPWLNKRYLSNASINLVWIFLHGSTLKSVTKKKRTFRKLLFVFHKSLCLYGRFVEWKFTLNKFSIRIMCACNVDLNNWNIYSFFYQHCKIKSIILQTGGILQVQVYQI